MFGGCILDRMAHIALPPCHPGVWNLHRQPAQDAWPLASSLHMECLARRCTLNIVPAIRRTNGTSPNASQQSSATRANGKLCCIDPRQRRSIPLIAPIVVLEAELLEEQVPISNGAELEHGFGGRIRARSRLCVVV